LGRFNEWCRRTRHLPVAEQRTALNRKLRGHDAYFGITGNAKALGRLRYEVQGRWRKWLSRRSRAAQLNWTQFNRLLQRHPLQPARVVHSVYAT
jgi:RNA-directed DNA polymerase